MPERETMQRVRQDRREGKHGARSAKQAIAIGLSKARRAGIGVPPRRGSVSASTRRKARQDSAAARRPHKPSPARSGATKRALKREGQAAGSHAALSRQARSAAMRRSQGDRSAAARKAARTKGPAKRSAAARKAARTRSRHAG